MRMFGLIGLVLALLVVGLVARKQMSAPAGVLPAGAASASARAQGAQVQQDFQRKLDEAMQRPKSSSEEQ